MSRKKPAGIGLHVYSFQVAPGISLSTEVTAATLEAAVDVAQRRGVQSLCHQCSSGEPAREWVTSGEIDCGHPAECALESVTIDGEEADDATMRRAAELWGGQ